MNHLALWLSLVGLLGLHPAAPGPLHGRTVLVDAGHGGRDSGATAHGIRESDLVLQIGRRLGAQLRASGARVVLARTGHGNLLDSRGKLPNRQRANLQARVDLAERERVDVYISVHANKAPGYPLARGGQVFLGRRPTPASRVLGSCLEREIATVTASRRRTDDRRELYLMEHLRMPSALVEVGFLSNADEARQMLDASYQNRVAQAIVRGVVCYCRQTGSAVLEERTQHPHGGSLVPLPHRITAQGPAHELHVHSLTGPQHL